MPATYEQAIAELETLVQRMESSDFPLQQSIEAYRRATALVTYCRDVLSNARQQVRVLEADLLKPFDAPEDED